LKRLSVITIVLTLPVLVASIYGMNVPIPFQNSPNAFWIPIILSLGISLVIGWFFLKRKIF
jgi:magnesium transporter